MDITTRIDFACRCPIKIALFSRFISFFLRIIVPSYWLLRLACQGEDTRHIKRFSMFLVSSPFLNAVFEFSGMDQEIQRHQRKPRTVYQQHHRR